jgi:hypothetical protein
MTACDPRRLISRRLGRKNGPAHIGWAISKERFEMKSLVATLLVTAAGVAMACPGDKTASNPTAVDAKPAPVAKAEPAGAAERGPVVAQVNAKPSPQKTTR